MDRFDWKQYVCDMKKLTESIVNGSVNYDILKKLQWKNIDNYQIKYDDDNIYSYMDFRSDLFDDAEKLIEPMTELLNVASTSGDIAIQMDVIEILRLHINNVYYQACCQKTCEENYAYLQMVEPLCMLVDELYRKLKMPITVYRTMKQKGW